MVKLDLSFYATMMIFALLSFILDSTPLSIIVGALLVCFEIGEVAEKIKPPTERDKIRHE